MSNLDDSCNKKDFAPHRLYKKVRWSALLRGSAFALAILICAAGLDAGNLFAGHFTPTVAVSIGIMVLGESFDPLVNFWCLKVERFLLPRASR